MNNNKLINRFTVFSFILSLYLCIAFARIDPNSPEATWFGQKNWLMMHFVPWMVITIIFAGLILICGLGFLCVNYCCVRKNLSEPKRSTILVFIITALLVLVVIVVFAGMSIHYSLQFKDEGLTLSGDVQSMFNEIVQNATQAMQDFKYTSMEQSAKDDFDEIIENIESIQTNFNDGVQYFNDAIHQVSGWLLAFAGLVLLFVCIALLGLAFRNFIFLRCFSVCAFFLIFVLCLLVIIFAGVSQVTRRQCTLVESSFANNDASTFPFNDDQTNMGLNITQNDFETIVDCLINGQTTPEMLNYLGIDSSLNETVEYLQNTVKRVNDLINVYGLNIDGSSLSQVTYFNVSLSQTVLVNFSFTVNSTIVSVQNQSSNYEALQQLYYLSNGTVALEFSYYLVDCTFYKNAYNMVFVTDFCHSFVDDSLYIGIFIAIIVISMVIVHFIAFCLGYRILPSVTAQEHKYEPVLQTENYSDKPPNTTNYATFSRPPPPIYSPPSPPISHAAHPPPVQRHQPEIYPQISPFNPEVPPMSPGGSPKDQ